MLVLVELDGQKVYLDPTDRALGFGRLRAGHEGTPALIYDPKKPEQIVLPATPFDQNLRRAELDLALDDKGRLAGTGTLRLTGHHAWEKIDWQDDAAKAAQAWKEWLEKRFRDFQISDVKAVESADEEKVTVTWALAQRAGRGAGRRGHDRAERAARAAQPSRSSSRPPAGGPASYFDYPVPRGGRAAAALARGVEARDDAAGEEPGRQSIGGLLPRSR